jgi:carboxymethylenebutenolidase
MLGEGIAMMLPQVANAAAVTEADVNLLNDAGRYCGLLLGASRERRRCRRSRVARHLRAAAGIPPDGKRLAESGYSVLVVNPFCRVKKTPTAEAGTASPIQSMRPLAQGLNETTHTTDAKALHRVAGRAISRFQNSQDRHAGLLHGRPDRRQIQTLEAIQIFDY